jgi:uncharacterized protein DUF481
MQKMASGVVALLAASPASAQPTFEKKGSAEDVKDVKDVDWTAKGELSLVEATGNARTTAIAASANAIRKDKENKLELTFAATYARATTRTAVDANMDGAIEATELDTATATSAENAQTKLRYDRYFSPLDAGYVTALGGADQPAGKDFFGSGQIGYSRGLYKNPCHEVLGEVGYDLTYVRLAAGSSTTIHSARLFAGYKGKLEEDAALEASVEALLNGTHVTYGMREAGALEATRVTATIGVTAGLSTKISLGASFTAKYENFPAPLAKIGGIPFAAGFEPPADKLDTTTKVSLVVKFL